jgi:hypothetical protein
MLSVREGTAATSGTHRSPAEGSSTRIARPSWRGDVPTPRRWGRSVNRTFRPLADPRWAPAGVAARSVRTSP